MTPTPYTRTAISLHWLMALLIVAGFGLGLYMTGLKLSPAKLKYYSWHKWLGVTVFLLGVARVIWRMTHAAPAHPAHMPEWQRKIADATHHLLYLLILVVPISGWIYSSAAGVSTVYLGLLKLPDLVAPDKPLAAQLKLVHNVLSYGLGALVLVHAGAAIKHHLIDRDDVLTRMLPFLRARAP